MMLLGIVLHSACSYMTVGLGPVWPYQDPSQTVLADLTVAFIHVFRMPIFFALAGFFAAMLYLRRGPGGLLNNRLQRIGIPLAVGLVVLTPFIKSGFTFAVAARDTSIGEAWTIVTAMAAAPATYMPRYTMHLWFLYDLLYFYVFAVMIAAACKRMPLVWRTAVLKSFGSLLKRPLLRVVIPGIVTALTLVPARGGIPTVVVFTPDFYVLMVYGVFFGFGWLLYFNRDALPSFDRFAWLQTVGGLVLYLGVKLGVAPAYGVNPGFTFPVAVQCLTGGIVVWMMFFGLTGLFLRYLDRPSARIRYIVDGSYWVYLVHLPCVAWMAGVLAGVDLPALLKLSIVLTTATVLGFVSYDLFARSSFIGQVLNGHRYPRGIPTDSQLEAAPLKAS